MVNIHLRNLNLHNICLGEIHVQEDGTSRSSLLVEFNVEANNCARTCPCVVDSFME